VSTQGQPTCALQVGGFYVQIRISPGEKSISPAEKLFSPGEIFVFPGET
jgi:hypothetical protein